MLKKKVQTMMDVLLRTLMMILEVGMGMKKLSLLVQNLFCLVTNDFIFLICLKFIMKHKLNDICIIGAGVIGLSIARSLKQSLPSCTIRILEKEKTIGLHTSGRNSGVLHAGFYYKTDS